MNILTLESTWTSEEITEDIVYLARVHICSTRHGLMYYLQVSEANDRCWKAQIHLHS